MGEGEEVVLGIKESFELGRSERIQRENETSRRFEHVRREKKMQSGERGETERRVSERKPASICHLFGTLGCGFENTRRGGVTQGGPRRRRCFCLVRESGTGRRRCFCRALWSICLFITIR